VKDLLQSRGVTVTLLLKLGTYGTMAALAQSVNLKGKPIWSVNPRRSLWKFQGVGARTSRDAIFPLQDSRRASHLVGYGTGGRRLKAHKTCSRRCPPELVRKFITNTIEVQQV